MAGVIQYSFSVVVIHVRANASTNSGS
jgi:hypothetical protein